MLMTDYHKIWQVLNSGKHVLLLIRDEGDPDVFQAHVSRIREWFGPVVKDDYGRLDLLMQNDAWLSMRRFQGLPCPTDPDKDGVQVMLL